MAVVVDSKMSTPATHCVDLLIYVIPEQEFLYKALKLWKHNPKNPKLYKFGNL